MKPTHTSLCPIDPYLYAVNITAYYYEIHSNVIPPSTAALFTLLMKASLYITPKTVENTYHDGL
jgi:hypothetical protein